MSKGFSPASYFIKLNRCGPVGRSSARAPNYFEAVKSRQQTFNVTFLRKHRSSAAARLAQPVAFLATADR